MRPNPFWTFSPFGKPGTTDGRTFSTKTVGATANFPVSET